MKRTLLQPDLSMFPDQFHHLLKDAPVYDSSCSSEASVFFLDRDQGFYLKSAPKNTLKKEADLTGFFHRKGLAPEVLVYCSDERDWLLTARVPGEDCTNQEYLENPKRLCDTIAELLWNLHHTDTSGCPVPDHTGAYLERVRRNYYSGNYDKSAFPDSFGYASAEAAWKVVEEYAAYLKPDTLLHGDYCLPNIMLDNWRFTGFIDLDSGGVGDRHTDIFWGVWTLFFNLKSSRYTDRFLDAYGRGYFQPELLRLIAACEVFG